MRRLTFKLDFQLDQAIAYQLIPIKSIGEDQIPGAGNFDKLVEEVRRLGCSYRLERLVEPEQIAARGTLP